MSLGLIVYNILSGILFLIVFPFLILYNLAQGKFSNRLVERLGRYPRHLRPDEPLPNAGPVWIHAVSVGEVKAAIALTRRIKEQLPDVPILVSTTTPAGRETAETLLGKEIPVIYFPLDFYPCVKRAVNFFRPRAFVALETELWPNFLFRADKSGSKLILANGRISSRSFKRYSKVSWLLRPVLEKFKVLMVRDLDDAKCLISLGAVPERVQVLGNIKYDGLVDQAKEDLHLKLQQRLHLQEGKPVIIAGSTRGGEEAILLTVYLRLKTSFPDLILFLVPRHIDRCAEIETLLKKQGVSFQLYSRIISSGEQREDDVILVDRIGDLFGLYSLATLAFCGASLIPKGGQNILEPAAWGKLVFYGPHMEDFKDARRLLEDAGAGIMVHDREALEKQMAYFLEHQEEREKRGEAGREILKSQAGLTKKAAEIIAEIIRN
ncbi:MAG: 3-deoxy-D-manno-octulosonic acid transferase [Deltaproteobacteria bacterium]|nr:3-deoxy-D-manno-octulosonic acid transferase [Deltaproteobacteria bacterium]